MAMPQRDNMIEEIKRLVLVLALVVCGGALWAVVTTWSGAMPPKTEIDLADITTVPVGRPLAHTGIELPSGGGVVQVKVPREWSEGGDCGALRVSGVFVDCGSRQIAGAMGSHVYPTVQEGAFAITNGLHAAVVSASRGTARFFPLQKAKDGSGTIRYEWNVEDKELELTIRCFVNERRQMAVCTLLHVKGDGIGGGLADRLRE